MQADLSFVDIVTVNASAIPILYEIFIFYISLHLSLFVSLSESCFDKFVHILAYPKGWISFYVMLMETWICWTKADMIFADLSFHLNVGHLIIFPPLQVFLFERAEYLLQSVPVFPIKESQSVVLNLICRLDFLPKIQEICGNNKN